MNKDFIPYSRQTIEDDDVQAVADVLRSPYLTTGPKVKEFEDRFSAYVETKHSVAFSSGTAALHAAMAVAGIKAGDEVLVPAMSFLATANAALYVGAKPIFVDSIPGGFNLDLNDAERKMTPRTKAIAPVHFAGEPVPMEKVHALAKKYNLMVIEDAAHALGARSQGKAIGGLSEMTIFSFHPVKHITTGEGGMVSTPSESTAKKLRIFRHHGIDMDVSQREAKQTWKYDMMDLGYNYRLSDIHSALGLSQLKKAERFLKLRNEIVSQYDKAFEKLPFVKIPPHARAGDRHVWHLYVIQLDLKALSRTRDDIFDDLRKQGIGVHVLYRPIYWHPYYESLGYKKGLCPQLEKTF